MPGISYDSPGCEGVLRHDASTHLGRAYDVSNLGVFFAHASDLARGPTPLECIGAFDMEGDGDIDDLADFAVLQDALGEAGSR